MGESRGSLRMLSRSIVVVFVVVSVAVVSLQAPLPGFASEAMRVCEQADLLNGHGLKRQAFREYTRALELDAKLSRAYAGRGKLELEFDDQDQAIADLRRALALEPKDDTALHALARAYFEKGQVQTAIDMLSKRLKETPDNKELLDLRGRLYKHLKQNEKAIVDFTRLIKLNDRRPYIYEKRADTFYNMKRYKEAVADYTEALKTKPKPNEDDCQEIYALRSKCYEKLGEKELARKDSEASNAIVDRGWGQIMRERD